MRIASAPGASAGLARHDHLDAARPQRLGQRVELGRLADPFPAFEADEPPPVISAHAIPSNCLSPIQARAKKPASPTASAATSGITCSPIGRRDDQVGDMLALGDRRLDRPLVADLHRTDLGQHARRDGDRQVARRDQATSLVAAQLDLARADTVPALNSGLACQALKPHCISRTDSSIRWLKLSRPATTMISRRPFCSADPVKP